MRPLPTAIRNMSLDRLSMRIVVPSQLKEKVMRHVITSLLLVGSFVALSTMEASAVVCARGVVRAGCVAAGGAAVVARPVVHSRRH